MFSNNSQQQYQQQPETNLKTIMITGHDRGTFTHVFSIIASRIFANNFTASIVHISVPNI